LLVCIGLSFGRIMRLDNTNTSANKTIILRRGYHCSSGGPRFLGDFLT
jgi:hypothetical protein